MFKLRINNKDIELPDKVTILEAAKSIGIKIPTLCHHAKLEPYGACRICLVDVATEKNPDQFRLLPACCVSIDNGLIVNTESDDVKEARIFITQFLLARCPDSEELQNLANEFGISIDKKETLDIIGKYLFHEAPKQDSTKCILCGQCVRVCTEITQRLAISFSKRGKKRRVKTPFDKISDRCIGCGSCAYVCPTNAISVEEAS